MSWIIKKPNYGDHIRVNRGLYYHHGIYAADNCIIHFASNEKGHETDLKYASICLTNIDDFRKESIVEVREFTDIELISKREPSEIINFAFTKLGETGYDIFNNNCEHFANECLFGEAKSSQVDEVKKFLKNIFR